MYMGTLYADTHTVWEPISIKEANAEVESAADARSQLLLSDTYVLILQQHIPFIQFIFDLN